MSRVREVIVIFVFTLSFSSSFELVMCEAMVAPSPLGPTFNILHIHGRAIWAAAACQAPISNFNSIFKMWLSDPSQLVSQSDIFFRRGVHPCIDDAYDYRSKSWGQIFILNNRKHLFSFHRQALILQTQAVQQLRKLALSKKSCLPPWEESYSLKWKSYDVFS